MFRVVTIDIDFDTIDDTFAVSISISTILSCRGVGSSIDDTFMAVFPRYLDIDTFEKTKMFPLYASHVVYSSIGPMTGLSINSLSVCRIADVCNALMLATHSTAEATICEHLLPLVK